MEALIYPPFILLPSFVVLIPFMLHCLLMPRCHMGFLLLGKPPMYVIHFGFLFFSFFLSLGIDFSWRITLFSKSYLFSIPTLDTTSLWSRGTCVYLLTPDKNRLMVSSHLIFLPVLPCMRFESKKCFFFIVLTPMPEIMFGAL